MMNSRLSELREICEATADIMLELYETFDNIEIWEKEPLPKPSKSLLRRGYSEPCFPVRRCARSHLPR